MSTQGTGTSPRDRLWRRLTRLTLGLTALVCLGYLAAFFSPSLLEGALPGSGPTPTQAVVQSFPAPIAATRPPTDTPLPSWTPMPTRTPRPSHTPGPTPKLDHTPGPTPTFPPTWTPYLSPTAPPPTRSNYP
jgi:hypothetical protein